jgi:serine/threonine-protein kinase
MAQSSHIEDRYEIREILGRGGMGVVYRAFDTLMRREVALKTILDFENTAALDLFFKEWGVLSTMVHPNVINIYDVGEFEHEGARKPFFVMPLLPGVTLDQQIKEGSARLTVNTVVDIIAQAARGLQAAHEKGLVHRDVKPSNIFVMQDDSVKLIDFGIARVASAESRTSLKGTLYYMAPEQLQMKPPSPQSDQYALAVTCYEALTRRRPFQGSTDADLAESILSDTPPPASDLNAQVSFAVSQVVHKGMAKQPFHRFLSTKEFGEALQSALRGELLDIFNPEKIRPRLQRARESFEQGDYAFASEILAEVEGEGHLDQDVSLLRSQLDHAIRKKDIQQLLDTAKRFHSAHEYPLALRKIQEALELDGADADALALKSVVEKERRERKIGEWRTLARQHLDNLAFDRAREAVENVFDLTPNDSEALTLVAEIERKEQDVNRLRADKQDLYRSARTAWERGELTSALSRLEMLVNLEREAPESDTGRSASYQNFYQQVRSEHDSVKNAYDEARGLLATDHFDEALQRCNQVLAKYPQHALLQALKFDVEERRRQMLSSQIADVDRKVAAEPDLDKRVALLEEASKQHPDESHFERALRLAREKRDLVNSIVQKAGYLEESGQFPEALDQWQMLRSIYGEYPGLDIEIQRVSKRKEQQARQDAKSGWVRQVDRFLETHEFERAEAALENALKEFPQDAELLELEKVVRKNRELARQASELLKQARELTEAGNDEASLEALRQGLQLDPRNTMLRTVLQNTLYERAQRVAEADPEAAAPTLAELLELSPNHPGARSLSTQIGDRKKEGDLSQVLAQARRLQADSNFDGALETVRQGLTRYPNEPRLAELEETLARVRAETQTVVALPSRTASPYRPPDSDAAPKPLALPNTLMMQIPADLSPPKTAPPPVPAARAKAGPRRLNMTWVVAGASAIAVLLVAAGLVMILGPSSEAPAVGEVSVSINASNPSAQIFIDDELCGVGDCRMNLLPGDHEVRAEAPGHQVAEASFTVSEGETPPPVSLTLTPLAPIAELASDLGAGTVTLNGKQVGTLEAGTLSLGEMQNGENVVDFANGAFRASFRFEATAGVSPRLMERPRTQGLTAVVVSGVGRQAVVYSSVADAQVSVDGRPAGTASEEGLAISWTEEGSREIEVSAPGVSPQKLIFEPGEAPTLVASFSSGRNLGGLWVVAGVDDAAVYINGDRHPRRTQRGRLLVYLTPRTYSIRVEKEGLETSEEQTVEVRRGEEARANFTLTPVTPAAPPPEPEPATESAGIPEPAAPEPRETAAPVASPAPKPAAEAPAGWTISEWENSGGWTRDGAYITKQGGDYVIASRPPRSGAYQFTILSRRGRRLRWVAAYRDERNHVLYELDDDELSRIDVINGRKNTVTKVKHGGDRKQWLTLRINVSGSSISTLVQQGDSAWRPLESGGKEGAAAGRFGFYLPGRDEIALSDFRFEPN